MTLNLDAGHKQIGANFNRFGIITTHIDGSGQTVYFDDITYAIAIAPPTLTIARTAPAEVRLQWPSYHTGFTLETALSLTPPILWTPITNQVTVNGGMFSVSVSTTEAAQFFRLRKTDLQPVSRKIPRRRRE